MGIRLWIITGFLIGAYLSTSIIAPATPAPNDRSEWWLWSIQLSDGTQIPIASLSAPLLLITAVWMKTRIENDPRKR